MMENKQPTIQPKLLVYAIIGSIIMYASGKLYQPLAFALFGLSLGFLMTALAYYCIKLEQKYEKEVKQ